MYVVVARFDGNIMVLPVGWTEAVEVWRGLEPTGYAAAVASSYASGGGTFYAPMNASADATASVQAPPPALMTREVV
ncbi:unnamed protein product [Hydatigera taeniaeformis]|uniref:DUF1330 domain-containing protein n=1 Tax=Hydatigena taeniaeformis TaxID=6205 RepID=A0A0R3WNA3_HYDTA|nr:unnamed protein product [Hydatigera taeniaeformis]